MLFWAEEVVGKEIVHDGSFYHPFHDPGDNRRVVNGTVIGEIMQRSLLMAGGYYGVFPVDGKYARI